MTCGIIVFLLGTAALVWFTWSFSIKERRYHGIFRFFAFEALLALLLLNHRHWFHHGCSPAQTLSWLVLFASLFLAVHGFRLLRRVGKPRDQIEDTTVLVEEGAFRYIRHPLYCSLLLLTIGIFLKRMTTGTTVLALISILALYLTAKTEEHEMLQKFGRVYEDYMRRTKMFIPWVW